MTKVKLSNGKLLNFPDQMSQDEIHQAIQKNFPSAGQATPEQIPGLQDTQTASRPMPQTQQQSPSQPQMGDTMFGQLPSNGQFFNSPEEQKQFMKGMINSAGSMTIPGGQFLRQGLNSLSDLPMIGNAIKNIGNSISGSPALNAVSKIGETGIEGGAMGAAQNPNDRLSGFESGALLGGAARGLGEGANAIRKGFQYLNGGQFANQVVNKLGQGAQNLRENAVSLAKDLQNLYQKHISNYQDIKNPVINQHGEVEMYPLENPSGYEAKRNIPELNLKGSDGKYLSPELEKSHSTFLDSPTIKNADDLQSAIGKEWGDVKSEAPSKDRGARLTQLGSARNLLKDEMDRVLRQRDPDGANALKEASDYYKNNVLNFRANKRLQKIVENPDTANLKNIHNIFDTANNKIHQIGSELPAESKNKLLYSAVEGETEPNALLQKLQSKQKRLGDYYTPEVKQDINSLSNKLKYGKIAKYATLGAAALTGLGGAAHSVNKLSGL
jgi:hypothetical protein